MKQFYEVFSKPEFRKLEDSIHKGVHIDGYSISQCNFRTPATACRFGDESWVLVGDSYAGVFHNALKEILEQQGRGLIVLTGEQDPFVSSDIWFGNVPSTPRMNKLRWEFIRQFKHPKTFLIVSNYYAFNHPKKKVPSKNALRDEAIEATKIRPDIAWQSYADNINKLIDLGHTVYVVYHIPLPDINVTIEFFKQLKSLKCLYPKFENQYHTGHCKRAHEYAKKLDSYLKDRPGLHKIYPTEVLCKNGQTRIIGPTGGLYHGGGHLSYFGAKMVLEELIFNNKK
ncbi:acyltransferase family protein [Elysia marginata]|uniref:Acyltransferase family protein n=1 Tax=Elysia marginata TaxID=1093978 RepID=A0AAV4G572_9GAST|nr:acyltransferase family protein [Elysia marginata]